MKLRTLSKRVVAALGATALGVATMTTTSMGAQAAPNAEPPSTPVPIATPDGMLMSYIINTRHVNPGAVRSTENAVKRAGGTVVQSWPEVGVVVAHSTKASFLGEIRKFNQVESAGPTRTAEVVEGTPGKAAPKGKNAAGYRTKVKKKVGEENADSSAAVATDPREVDQWNNDLIGATEAHKTTDGDRSVLVGVVDSGIDADHPDLKENIDVRNSVNCTKAGTVDTSATGWQPTTSDHGTHVAGTIAAARNGVGIVGVAPNVRMASIKVVSDEGFIYPEYAVCGFIWAAEHGVDVTNNSYYVDPFEFWCGDQDLQAPAKEAVRRAVEFSTKKGVVHAAAAGNSAYDLANKTTDEGSPNDTTPVNRVINSSCTDIPAELPGVVTVSAIDKAALKADFSNYGDGVIDVAAPGRSILSTVVADNGYGLKSGTSMASPHAAGVLALLKSTHPRATPQELIDLLREQATDHECAATDRPSDQKCTGDADYNSFYGDGVINALAAVQG